VEAASLQIESFEALLRWNHPLLGRLYPDDFVPLAEGTRLIDAIGKWVLQQACTQCAAWPSHIKVAVNVSAVQLGGPQLPALVAGTLLATGLAADRLELEITESAPLSSDDSTLDVLNRLRALGVLIATDDFGKGYATLSSLARFPFDKIKIDRSFLQRSCATNGTGRMLEALAAMARALGIATTVEGVEIAPQVPRIRVLGFKQMQGFLFGRPMSAH
jgi:EAL domain-containing protein (putative c-di-GMP-specific phosphodiesterase class I)